MKNADRLLGLFETGEGAELYRRIVAFLDQEELKDALSSGALLGLSGGADSVFCLLFLLRYARDFHTPPPICLHVEHGIRGASAQRDAAFSVSLCDALGVACEVRHFDVPALARERKQGIEECARYVRYREFNDIISGRDDHRVIVTAHNATDQVETILQRMMRGTGTSGLCGIPPRNGNVVRPLLSLAKGEIVAALDRHGIPYVTDETNADTRYSRNYIRNEILPALQRLTNSPEVSVMRLSRNLRMDEDYFSHQVDAIMSTAADGALSRAVLASLHPAMLARVLKRMCEAYASCRVEAVHVDAIRLHLSGACDFCISLPGDCVFRVSGDCAAIVPSSVLPALPMTPTPVLRGIPIPLSDGESRILVADAEDAKTFLNVYKILTQQRLSSVILEGELRVRSRTEGDRIRMKGMNRRLKTLFNAAKIPPADRSRIPVLEDARGIVWVPGIGVRDDGVDVSDAPTVFILQHI